MVTQQEKDKVKKEFLKLWQYGHPRFYELIWEACELHERKNRGYATTKNPLSNFYECEQFGVPGWQGCLVRMCYDKETEILTKNGWKFFKDLNNDDKVASLENGNFVWSRIERKEEYQYSGKMYHLRTKSLDIKVTPEHNLYLKPRHSTWRFLKPEEAKRLRSFSVKLGANWYGRSKSFIFKNSKRLNSSDGRFIYSDYEWKVSPYLFLRFLGFWLAEGSLKAPSIIRISQANEEKKEWIINLIKELGWKPNVSGNEIYFSNKSVYRYLRRFGKDCYSKHLLKQIKELPKKELKELLLAYSLGDGWKTKTGTIILSTSSRKLADDFQEIGIKAGFAPKIYEKKQSQMVIRSKKYNTKVNYNIILSTHVEPEINKRNTPLERWEHYTGKVYCCTVPSNIILVRRNGKPIWSGNSDKWSRIRNLALSETQSKIDDVMLAAKRMENITDTLFDLGIYSFIDIILYEEHKAKTLHEKGKKNESK